MADNVVANPGVGGATFATDDDGTAQHPYAKMEWGGDNTQTKVDVGGSAVPIQDGGNSITVDGSVTVTQATGTNLHVVADTGSTTAVTGNVTVVQATGTNLHVVADTGSTTAVTGNVTAVQATGTNLHTVVDSGTITAVTSITNALPSGTNVIGHVIADTGSTTAVTGNVTAVQATGSNLHVVTDSGTITTVSTVTAVTAISNALPAGTNNIGGVTPQPLSTGGLSFKSFVSANSNNKASVGAACRIYFISIQNIQSVPVYLKMFNAATGNVTAGTTACDLQFMCPANSTAANGAGIVLNFDPGISMATDLTYLLTTGIGTTDNTSVAANSQVVTIGYK